MKSRRAKRPVIALVTEGPQPEPSLEARAMQHQAIVHDIAVRTVSFPFDTIDRDVIGLVVPPRYRLTDATLEFFPNLRYVGVPSVGTDHVLALGASAPQVRIVNAPGFNTEEVAEHTVAFILMLLRGVPRAQRIVASGGWDSRATDARRWNDSVVGLVGFGAIARRVSQICLSLGLRVLVWNRSSLDMSDLVPGLQQVPVLDDLLRRSDVVSLHVPDVPGTHHLIDADALAKMKPTAALINVGRGGLISEQALAAALDEGRLRAAALDVLEIEPPDGSSPLLHRQDVIITPHSAWYSPRSSVRAYEIVAREIAALMARGSAAWEPA